MSNSLSETKVLGACQILFGEEVKLDRNFLYYLQPGGLKSAFRRRAKEVHPDLLQRGGAEMRRRRTELFRQLVEAHDLVCEFFRQRDAGLWGRSSAPPPGGRQAHAPTPAGDGYYRGPVPQLHLTIGRYCYYRGVVPYPVLIEALAWQRRQRPLLGEIARRWGWLDDDGVRRINAAGRPRQRFGERAVALGLLGPHQVQSLLLHQKSRQLPLGRYFVEGGFVSSTEMDRLVAEMHRHNAQLSRRAATL